MSIDEKALNAIRAAEELLIYDGYTSPQSTAKTILRNIIEGNASARKDEEEVADSVSPSPPSSPATQQPDRCTSWRQWWAMKPKLPEQNMQQLEPMGDKELKQVEMGCMAWLLHDGEHEASLRLSRILQRLTDAEKRLSEREYDAHLEGCPLYNEEETRLMRDAYERALARGVYTEALYAVATAILRHRGHLPPVTEEKVYVGCCVSCGETTEYACADCKIDTRKTVYVCGKKDCRGRHESSFCTRNVTKLMQSNPAEEKPRRGTDNG